MVYTELSIQVARDMWRGAVSAYRHAYLKGSSKREVDEAGVAARFWHDRYRSLLSTGAPALNR